MAVRQLRRGVDIKCMHLYLLPLPLDPGRGNILKSSFLFSSFTTSLMKEFLELTDICRSRRNNKSGTFFLRHGVEALRLRGINPDNRSTAVTLVIASLLF